MVSTRTTAAGPSFPRTCCRLLMCLCTGHRKLRQDDTPDALEVRFADGTWGKVQPRPGAFVINLGDMLSSPTAAMASRAGTH